MRELDGRGKNWRLNKTNVGKRRDMVKRWMVGWKDDFEKGGGGEGGGRKVGEGAVGERVVEG